MEEGDIASFFVEGLGLALAPKTCPDQSQAFEEVNSSQAFPWQENFFSPFFFLNEPLPDAPKACAKFLETIGRTDCVGPMSSTW